MHTVTGTVVASVQNVFEATFVIDGAKRTYNGTINPAVSKFNVDPATLTYDDDDQLTGTDSYHGTIGTDLKLNFDKGPTITGKLENDIAEASIDGGGPWNR